MEDRVKTGLGPVAASDARLFVLGSLPGDASLAAQRYYAHPQNQFWRLLERVIGGDLHALPYAERLERLAKHKIGLWDVIATAERRGSLDQAIRSAGHNPLSDYLGGFADLRAVAFNGSTAAAIGRRLLSGCDLQLIDLPSSSPANTRPFAEKAEAWQVLGTFL
jgi:hypoxanthine-DNA glycosylase